MTWFAGLTTGFGLGLASFGGLWLTVQQFVCRRPGRILLDACGLARLLLVGLTLFALSREGGDKLLAGFAGLWLARWCVIRRLAGVRHGE